MRLAPEGAWVSILFDSALVALLCYRHWLLEQLDRCPASYPGTVTVTLHPRTIGVWEMKLDLLLLAERAFIVLAPEEFRKDFGSDPARVDLITPNPETLTAVGLTLESWRTLPHMPVYRSQDERDFLKWLSEARVSKRWNRLLHHDLAPELWRTSVRLSSMTPGIIAERWKLFHLQDEFSGRLITLFNTMDLLQRWIGSMVFSLSRKHGTFPDELRCDEDFLRLGSFSDWNRALDRTLTASADPDLDCFRIALASPYEEFEANLNLLIPYWESLGCRPKHDRCNVLQVFSAIGFLRNQLLAHGAIPWRMRLDPEPYVCSLYQCFLRQAARVSDLIPRVLAYPGHYDEGFDKTCSWAMDAGVLGWSPRPLGPGDHESVLVLSAKHLAVRGDPYVRVRNGRVVILNRIRSDHSEYIDFQGALLMEPTFVSVPSAREEFVGCPA